jgi:hypothetical protein
MLAGILAAIAACATEPMDLRHPETGDRVRCGPYSYNPILAPDLEAALAQQKLCTDLYQRQGYEPVPEEAKRTLP